MPANIVKTPRDERLWKKAKARVREEYPDVAEDSDRFYALVMGIFKKMSGRDVSKAMAAAVRARVAGTPSPLAETGWNGFVRKHPKLNTREFFDFVIAENQDECDAGDLHTVPWAELEALAARFWRLTRGMDDHERGWRAPLVKGLATLLKGKRKVARRGGPRKTKSGKVTTVRPHTTTVEKRTAGVKVATQIHNIPLEQVQVDVTQHRETKGFEPASIAQLGASIKKQGQQVAIMVQPIKGKGEIKYQIIGGERRWRAMNAIGAKYIKAEIVTGATAEDMRLRQIIENVSRVDLAPMDEAKAYRQGADDWIKKARRRKEWQRRGKRTDKMALDEKLEDAARAFVAEATGKTRAHIAFYLTLWTLDPEVQEMVKTGGLSPRDGNTLARLTAGVYDRRELRERYTEQRRIARHARAQGIVAGQLVKLVSARLGQLAQGEMFEQTADEAARSAKRADTKAHMDRIAETVADAIARTFSATAQEFDVGALTAGDLRVNVQKLQGAQETLGQIVGLMEEEVFSREATEAAKRRVSKPAPAGGATTVGALALPRLFKALPVPGGRRSRINDVLRERAESQERGKMAEMVARIESASADGYGCQAETVEAGQILEWAGDGRRFEVTGFVDGDGGYKHVFGRQVKGSDKEEHDLGCMSVYRLVGRNVEAVAVAEAEQAAVEQEGAQP